jgi:hypothetical protein
MWWEFRDLEKTVKDLQDSIIKKNPNSLTALIKAASVSDSVQAERANQRDAIESMKVVNS